MVRVLVLSLIVSVALVGNSRAQEDELIEMVIGFLNEPDKEIRAIAHEQVRNEAKGTEATKAFAAELPKLTTESQIGLLSALADRGDVAAKPTVLSILSDSKDDALREAAANALGKLGDETDCETLMGLLSASGKVATAARQGLIQLRGDGVSSTIVQGLAKAPTQLQASLVDILTARRAIDEIPALLKMATGKDAALRGAAMKSLGQLAGPEHVPALVKGVLAATKGNERNAAEKNLMSVCNRIEDNEKRSEPLLAAMNQLNSNEKTELLPALGRVGGKAAFAEIDSAIKSRNAAIHLAGIRGISNWPDSTVAKRLIELARTDKHPDHQRIARMSLLRIAPLPDGRTDAEKLALLKTGMTLAANERERNYGLKRAAPIRIVETLRFVVPFVDQPKYAEEACQTVVELAHDRQLRDDNKPEFHAALDKVIATTKDATLIDRANRYKNGQTWVRPK